MPVYPPPPPQLPIKIELFPTANTAPGTHVPMPTLPFMTDNAAPALVMVVPIPTLPSTLRFDAPEEPFTDKSSVFAEGRDKTVSTDAVESVPLLVHPKYWPPAILSPTAESKVRSFTFD